MLNKVRMSDEVKSVGKVKVSDGVGSVGQSQVKLKCQTKLERLDN
jgi:hypothetical protein